MEQGHAPALPVPWAPALLLYVTPPCYSSCICPAGGAWCGSSNAQPAISAETAFSHGSSHYLGRRHEVKTGAAGSGLGDLAGGIFPAS